MFWKIFILVCVSSLRLSESLTFHIEGNKTSFTFPLGVTSQIKFYVRNEDDFRVYVQHKAAEKDNYNTMCIVYQTASKVCSTNNNICRCPEDTNNAFSLNKIFLQSDAGLWMFRPWQHNNISKTVNVSISEQKSTTWTLQSNIQTTSELATTKANSPMTSQPSLTTTTRVTSEVASSTLTTVSETTLVGINHPSDLKQNRKKTELTSSDIASMAAVFVFTLVIIITLALDIFLWLNPEVDLLQRCR
ncbi:uncharacterized protein LOC112568316 [Pomacea canaliculata]|uniref:uncharacterized protein LOC112568316 n=1 Tax=Pomacea canaliculata TaxID=400727 RepID=UPI000D739677|nr:uncharacterized protein LOC112568316 [Pomacea canaliculata]